MKAGYKTTEFWTSLMAQVAGIAVLFGLVTPEQASTLSQAATSIVGGLLAAAGAFGYAHSRGTAKKYSEGDE